MTCLKHSIFNYYKTRIFVITSSCTLPKSFISVCRLTENFNKDPKASLSSSSLSLSLSSVPDTSFITPSSPKLGPLYKFFVPKFSLKKTYFPDNCSFSLRQVPTYYSCPFCDKPNDQTNPANRQSKILTTFSFFISHWITSQSFPIYRYFESGVTTILELKLWPICP